MPPLLLYPHTLTLITIATSHLATKCHYISSHFNRLLLHLCISQLAITVPMHSTCVLHHFVTAPIYITTTLCQNEADSHIDTLCFCLLLQQHTLPLITTVPPLTARAPPFHPLTFAMKCHCSHLFHYWQLLDMHTSSLHRCHCIYVFPGWTPLHLHSSHLPANVPTNFCITMPPTINSCTMCAVIYCTSQNCSLYCTSMSLNIF